MTITNVSRRRFLRSGGAAGASLVLGVHVPAFAQGTARPAGGASLAPNAFVRIGTDNTVTVIAKHLEMGQGIHTGLATLVAEELDAAWAQIRVEGAPADATRYANLTPPGKAQWTGASTSLANSWAQLRAAGATARAMLVAAAAQRFGVPAASLTVRNGTVAHAASKRSATFGELAAAAAALPVPPDASPKDPKDWTYIGKPLARVDARAKSSGAAVFTQDFQLPGLLTAVVARPPRFGARVADVDASGVQGMPGVRHVVEIDNGVAVLATGFWAAKKARDALKIKWDDARAFSGSSAEIMAGFRKAAGEPGAVARTEGDAAKAIAGAARIVEASYELPYLAHATMEPMDCVMRLGEGNVLEVWNGEQLQTGDQLALARYLGIKPEQIRLNMLYAGGSFGRRGSLVSDYLLECASLIVALARQDKRNIPVKLVWAREDDMRAGGYRPAFFHELKAGLDASGSVVGWQHRLVGQSISAGTFLEALLVKDGVDKLSVEGAADVPYAFPAIRVELHSPKLAVPVLWWRSSGSSHTAFAVESFVDELAASAGKDALEYRKVLLALHPRHIAVLELAAKQSGWGTALAAGKPGEKRGRGIAVHEYGGTVVAQVAEVTVKADNAIVVDRVVCAVDCGIAVNPDIVRTQMEGGIGFGLSAALHGAITFKDGAVEQSNFNDYRILRIDEMPRVEVHIVPSTEAPTGVGEPGVPPIAPAVANAVAAATGKRLRSLPLKLG